MDLFKAPYNTCHIHTLMAEGAMEGANSSSGVQFMPKDTWTGLGEPGIEPPITRCAALPPEPQTQPA